MPRLIGLSGLKGSGKDSVADALGWPREAFAAPLKRAVLTLDPIIDADGTRLSVALAGSSLDTLKRSNPEVRRLLQVMGTEVVRQIVGESAWVDLMRTRAREHLAGGADLVITDVRFPNEAELIHQLGGAVIEVRRPGLTSDGHASETPLPEHLVDLVIDNNRTLEDLRTEVAHLPEDLGRLG